MKKLLVVSGALLVLHSTAFAAGFEKSVLWSGKEAGYAASGLSYVMGAESLFFNPAGLAAGENGNIVANLSPTSIKLEGHLASATRLEETDKNFSLLGGGLVSYKVTPQFGIGVGAYAAGGSKAVYESVDLSVDASTVTYKPTIETDLKIVEYSIGAAYELAPGFRLGLAWRIGEAKGGFSSIKKTVTNTAYSYLSIKDAKDTLYNGFRVGLQYQSEDNQWGLGAVYRSAMDFNARGTSTGTTTIIPTNSTTTTTGSGGSTTVATSLPSAISVGGNYLATDSLRLLGAVDYVDYSHNSQLTIGGAFGATAIPNLVLNWKDMWNFRVGGEYALSDATKIRMGYALTTRVTSKTDARATLSPPGTGHTITAGAGMDVSQGLELNGALEYAFNTGSGAMTAAGTTTKELLSSVSTESKAKSMGFHAGLSYKF